MAANVKEDDPMYQMMMNAPKILEINPKSPLIIGLLERVMELPAEDENSEEAKDLGDIVQVLFDTTSVRSGFTVGDSNE
jgi:heat shock protein beta